MFYATGGRADSSASTALHSFPQPVNSTLFRSTSRVEQGIAMRLGKTTVARRAAIGAATNGTQSRLPAPDVGYGIRMAANLKELQAVENRRKL